MKNQFTYQLNRLRYALLGSALAAAVVVTSLQLRADNEKTRAADVRVQVDHSPIKRESGPVVTSFAPVVKEVSPSVVTISTTQKGQRLQMRGNPLMEDPFWAPFFGGPRGGGPREFRTPDRQGVGSGVIISKDGYILTNNHVVDGADEVQVGLSNGDTKEYTAKVVGKDPKSDIAVLKIDAQDLPAITFGDSDQIQVGDLVLALGNPFGVGQTVTMGMVSALGRANLGLDYEDFIQTDAAINPGNSGGALVDAHGRLIGINTAIISQTGGSIGIGFAIPINRVERTVRDIRELGYVPYAGLGVTLLSRPISLEIAINRQRIQQETGMRTPLPDHGLLIPQVDPQGPAGRAGMRDLSVLFRVGDREINELADYHQALLNHSAGDRVEIEFWVNGETKTAEVVLADVGRG